MGNNKSIKTPAKVEIVAEGYVITLQLPDLHSLVRGVDVKAAFLGIVDDAEFTGVVRITPPETRGWGWEATATADDGRDLRVGIELCDAVDALMARVW